MLVSTTLVRALYLIARLVTACPHAWNATSAMGTRTSHVMASLLLGGPLPPAPGPKVTMDAAAMQRVACSVKEAMRVERFLGPKCRWKRLKKKEPMQKKPREVPDLIHRVPSVGAARPRPM